MVLISVFIIGLFIGSFLNLLIDRLPRDEQIVSGRSHCDHCGKVLSVFELIPVASWLVLGGKCRKCHYPIPFRNSLVELITGILFTLSYNHTFSLFLAPNYELQVTNYEFLISQFLNFLIISSLIVIFFIDLKHQLIPEILIIIAAIASLILNLMKVNFQWLLILPYLFSSLGALLFFLLLYLLTKGKGMGFGDVELAGMLGLFLGFPQTIFALYIAFLTGAFFSVILIVRGKKRFGQTIAFGPFLVIGILVAYFFKLNFLNVYLGF